MNFREGSPTNTLEREATKTIVELIAPRGLGFGKGEICVKRQIEEGVLTRETPMHIYDVLTKEPNAFKKVEADDDGCGDGRPWSKIVQFVSESGKRRIRLPKSSLLRAKVFGGGLVAASSMWRTLTGAPKEDQTVGDDRKFMAGKLKEMGFSHGAHSDDHAKGDKCGCGAIDNYPAITENACFYRKEITSTLKSIYGEDFEDNEEAIIYTFGVYKKLAENKQYFSDASGKKSMDQILESGAVVKELQGRHVEETIVLNEVAGTTLDQQYFTQTVKAACKEDKKPQTVQAFVIDTWRGRQIADVVAKIAHEENPATDIEEVRKIAYADFLIRTLAVSGTLTAGDLPVYRRRTIEANDSE